MVRDLVFLRTNNVKNVESLRNFFKNLVFFSLKQAENVLRNSILDLWTHLKLEVRYICLSLIFSENEKENSSLV